jgi:TrmH family RNA methyltransferase
LSEKMKKFRHSARNDLMNSGGRTVRSFLRLYRSLDRRKIRDETGLLPLEGTRLVREAYLSGASLEAVILSDSFLPQEAPFLAELPPKVPLWRVEEDIFLKAAKTETPQGILAVARRPSYTLADVFADEPALVLVVDRVQDPGNLGTMLRSAAAAGAGGAVLLPGTADAGNPKAGRAAMGAIFRLPVVEASLPELLPELRRRDVQLVAATANAKDSYHLLDWSKPSAIAIGNEGDGLSTEVLAAANRQVAIPLAAGIESLNAAVAMSVIFFEAARQRSY